VPLIPESENAEHNGWDAQRLRLVLAAARLGDWSWEIQTDLVSLSPRAAAIFGIDPPRGLTRAALLELIHPDDREQVRAASDRAAATRTDYVLQYRVVHGGRERWVSAAGRGRYDHRGVVLDMYGVVQDITADRILMRVDDAVRPLVKSEDITYTAARLLGEHLAVNRCAYAFVEDDEDTFILTGNYTHGTHSIVGRYRFRQFGAECLRSMRAGEPYVVEDSETDPRIDADDRVAYAATAIRAVICVPILKSGRFVAGMAVHTNTIRQWCPAEVELVQQVASRCWESIERSRVERERARLLEVAEAANRAKDEFLAMLGHELRNPLAPIVSALQVMALRDEGSSSRERTIIERQVTHLTRLVDDLLDVSRIARGMVELKLSVVELSDIVSEAVEIAAPLIEQHEHAVVIEVPRSGLAIEADAARLTQVVVNLLTNAAKYTPTGGQITISAELEGERCVLRVLDTGVGMSATVLSEAFDPFVQGHRTIDRSQGGLGLGLTIVKSLVERHGGSVTARSEGSNKGSEFIVTLPQTQPKAASVARPAARCNDQDGVGVNGARILVVDDNVDAAEMLAVALGLRGCDVSVAHDGCEALRLAETTRFDAALLDIGLPIMDGYELAARLRALPNAADTQLVAVTGYGQEDDRRRALAAGFHRHLVKPVDLRVLETIVASLPPSPCG
jgi:PAS domain S-box-containing protein